MLTVVSCIVYEHDLRLVVLAALICATASFAAITLLHHARKSTGYMQGLWLGVGAVSAGFGIWATHFIAMLAFSPGIPSAYNIFLTVLSLVAAIVLTGMGLTVGVLSSFRAAPWLGGAMVGGGIAAMHYTGMAAFEIQGRIVWDPTLVAASLAFGAAIGAVSLPAGLHGSTLKWKLLGALLLTVAICSHHFTAMGAATIVPDPTVDVSNAELPAGLLAIAVALASFIILMLALAGVAIDLRDRRRSELEEDRMRGLANAAIEGLLVCEGETIVTVNDSFAALIGGSVNEMIGSVLEQCLPDQDTRRVLLKSANHAVEGYLLRKDGSRIPVELVQRTVDFAGKPHSAIAVRDLRARRQAEKRIRFLAHNDPLTGLPNRSSFNTKLDHEIDQALVTGRKLAVLCLDLDRFKEVNDLFGHAEGDRVLQMVGKRLTGILDEGQMAARLGGDEFAVIIPGLSNPGIAGRVAETILEALQGTGEDAEDAPTIASSIGIAICPNDGSDRQTLLTQADTALYRAKNEGRGTYRFFEASMGEKVRDRRLMEHDLRNAIAREELGLVYQPQADLQTGKIVGVEVLLRWKHPTRGDISPADFIPIAEDSGIILQIGEWVLRTACREAASWDKPLTVAVNVSAMQIHNVNFAQQVHEILFETGLAPGRLELEITETALVRDLHRALTTLRKIKMLGVRIAMDDFGTGYSSLSNLRAFPFDKIKIDGSFIKSVDVNDQAAAIVRSVLGLGKALNLPVLAEGVETPAELAFLQSEHCTEVQGYLLGRPTAIESLRELTHNESDAPPTVVPAMPKVASM